MSKRQAIKPDFFANIPSLIREKLVGKEVTDEEKSLYSMSKSAGWKIFNGFAEDLLENLDGANESAISQGASFEDIGRNTIVVMTAKGIIKRLLDKVEDAREACEPKPEAGGK